MTKITLYQKPTCTTCREVYKALKESGVNFDAVDYYVKPLSRAKIKDLLKKSRLRAVDILRTKEDIYRKLGLADKKTGEDELIDLMVKYPDLIQRPIIESGDKAMLARPAEKIRGFIEQL